MRLALFFLLLSGSLVACSGSTGVGSSYDAETGLTRYSSASIPLGRSQTAVYGAGTSIVLEAEAECRGEGCSPETYVVRLSNPSPNPITTDFNQVQFTTPQGTVSFEPGQRAEGGETTTFFSSGRGELVRILLPRDIFASFATSQEFSVRLGSNDYRVPYGARASLRRMVPGLPENQ